MSPPSSAEARLAETQRRLATLLRNLPGMAYRYELERGWTLVFVSEGCRPLTGYQPWEITDHRVCYCCLIHPEDHPRVRDTVQKALDAGRSFQLEYRICARDGRVKWVWEQGSGVHDPDGRLIAREGVVHDVTEWRRPRRRRSCGALSVNHERIMQVVVAWA